MLDYTFSHLGLAKDNQIEYPLMMTEAMCNPNYSRGLVSELLFECYRVPAVSYSVDSLLAFYYNASKQGKSSGLIINSSHSATHIVPVLDE
jgi:actin-related protein 5